MDKSLRVVARVERHPGGLYPRGGFIVTNITRPAEQVVTLYRRWRSGRCPRCASVW